MNNLNKDSGYNTTAFNSGISSIRLVVAVGSSLLKTQSSKLMKSLTVDLRKNLFKQMSQALDSKCERMKQKPKKVVETTAARGVVDSKCL